MKKNLLFICSANLNRSPTAEIIFKDNYNTKSAGIDMLSPIKVSKELLEWADIIFVMEEWHRYKLKQLFPDFKKKVFVLNIPDMFGKMDEELIKILKVKIKKYLD